MHSSSVTKEDVKSELVTYSKWASVDLSNKLESIYYHRNHFTTIAQELVQNFKSYPSIPDDKTIMMKFEFLLKTFQGFLFMTTTYSSKSTGLDNISVRILKSTSPFIILIIIGMLNQTLVEAVFSTY